MEQMKQLKQSEGDKRLDKPENDQKAEAMNYLFTVYIVSPLIQETIHSEKKS